MEDEMPEQGAAHAAEKFFRRIGASAVHRICLFIVIDPLHFEAAMEAIPV
jgi:hypothetical protein